MNAADHVTPLMPSRAADSAAAGLVATEVKVDMSDLAQVTTALETARSANVSLSEAVRRLDEEKRWLQKQRDTSASERDRYQAEKAAFEKSFFDEKKKTDELRAQLAAVEAALVATENAQRPESVANDVTAALERARKAREGGIPIKTRTSGDTCAPSPMTNEETCMAQPIPPPDPTVTKKSVEELEREVELLREQNQRLELQLSNRRLLEERRELQEENAELRRAADPDAEFEAPQRAIPLEPRGRRRVKRARYVEDRGVLATLKAEGSEAVWRSSARQLVRLIKAPVLAMLSKNVAPKNKGFRSGLATFLDTPLGEAALAGILGAALAKLPVPDGYESQAERLGEELRIQAMSAAGDVVLDAVTGPLFEVITLTLKGLPKIEVDEPPAPAAQIGERTGLNRVDHGIGVRNGARVPS